MRRKIFIINMNICGTIHTYDSYTIHKPLPMQAHCICYFEMQNHHNRDYKSNPLMWYRTLKLFFWIRTERRCYSPPMPATHHTFRMEKQRHQWIEEIVLYLRIFKVKHCLSLSVKFRSIYYLVIKFHKMRLFLKIKCRKR